MKFNEDSKKIQQKEQNNKNLIKETCIEEKVNIYEF